MSGSLDLGTGSRSSSLGLGVGARRGSDQSTAGNPNVSNQKLMQQMVKLDGEFKGLRAQFTEFKKKIEGGISLRSGADAALLNELMSKLSEEREQRLSMHRGFVTTHKALKDDVQQHRNELRQCRNDVQHLSLDFKKHKREVEDTRHGTKDFPHQKLQAVSNELHLFQKRIFDSGVLQPKVEKPADPEEPEPVGSLELGQDVYSARLLMRLGMQKAKSEAKSEAKSVRSVAAAAHESKPHASGADLESYELMKAREAFSDLDSASDSSGDLDLHDPHDLLHGMPAIEVRPGDRGYFQLTKGWLAVCVLTNILQFAAVSNIIAFGLLQGSNCLNEPLTRLEWYNLHISKFFGMIVIGCFMSGDVMDTVNFMMVEILLEPRPSIEVCIFAAFRVMFILLVTTANGILFIIATSPDGIWLYITAVEFVNALTRSMIPIAKSGILGHAISKQITDMNFMLCFKQDYPWWFSPVRFVAHLFMFGMIGAFACFAFVMPIQMCPAEGKPANIFWHMPTLIR